jgi:TonB family protein
MSASFALKILATASLSLLLPALAPAATSTCDPHVLSSPTKFPLRSQLRGQQGIVYLNVSVDENGRVTDARLARSSGHRLLDRAATRSVLADWVFDVSDCVRKDLPATDVVAVDYRNEEYR